MRTGGGGGRDGGTDDHDGGGGGTSSGGVGVEMFVFVGLALDYMYKYMGRFIYSTCIISLTEVSKEEMAPHRTLEPPSLHRLTRGEVKPYDQRGPRDVLDERHLDAPAAEGEDDQKDHDEPCQTDVHPPDVARLAPNVVPVE